LESNVRSSNIEEKIHAPVYVEILYTPPLSTAMITNQSVIAFISGESSPRESRDRKTTPQYAQTTHNLNKTLIEMQPI